MRLNSMIAICSMMALLTSPVSRASIAYPNPPGGWSYVYEGDQLQVGDEGSGWTSLDGTWSHDNNSDAWDGSEIGGSFAAGGGAFLANSPGGASLGTQNGVKYLRMQDTGDPRDYGYADPCSRKVYFGHNVGSDIDPTKASTIMDTGITLTFRARIPTLSKAGPPLDPLHRDGQQSAGIKPYPDDGDGYVTSDGGKGNFVIRQGGNGGDVPAGAIAFSFTQSTDTTGGDPNAGQAKFAGLTFNEFNGNVPSDAVNFGQGSKTNVIAFDPTEWHELYIVIRKDPSKIGTHEAFIFWDGNLTPVVFKMTAGTGSDMNDTFLALGGSATPQNWALDVDWFGYKDEAVFPPGAKLPPSIADFSPANNAMFQTAANGITFNSAVRMPGNTLPAAGFKLILNDQDVSSQLTLSGTDASTSRSATYKGLQANAAYLGTIMVTDSGGLSITNDIAFDTFVESQSTIIEAEDYNFSGGQSMDNPPAGGYAGQAGTAGVDFSDTTSATFGAYREQDPVDIATTTDMARSKFTNAGATDYQIGTIGPGEWWNYTRTLAAANYLVNVRVATTVAQDIRLDRVTGSASQSSQSLEYLGTIRVPRTGTLNSFSYLPLIDAQGQPIAVPLSGKTTLRLTAGNANDNIALNYLLLVPSSAATDPLVSVQPSAGNNAVLPDTSIEAAIYDGSSPVDKGTVKLFVNGAESAATVVKSGSLTTVKYASPTLWSPASTYAVKLTFNDGSARNVDWTFTTANYPVLTSAMKVSDARTSGFVWRMFQNEANQDTTVQKAEDALAGRLKDANGQTLPNLADPNVTGPASALGSPANPGTGVMTFKIPTVINVSQIEGDTSGSFTPDELMPGTPGLNTSNDGIAVEIRTFIELPRGLVTMFVNSDDGFQTTAGYLNDSPLVLGEYNGGRSAADSTFQFAVEEAGVYAFRTLYFEGNGDARLEWSMMKPDGSRALINDTAQGGARAYQEGTIPARPAGNVVITIRAAAGGQVILEWASGTLQSANAVTGAYQDVSNATSPYTTPTSNAPKFYRVKK